MIRKNSDLLLTRIGAVILVEYFVAESFGGGRPYVL